jgi:hypothetical protein
MKYYTTDGIGAIQFRPKQDAGQDGMKMADVEVAIWQVRLHLSAASAAETFTIAIDSGINARYDAVLDAKAMNTLADYFYQPTMPHYLRAGDDLLITKTNAAGLAWSVTIIYE